MVKKVDKHEHNMVLVAIVGMVAIVAMFMIFLTNQAETQEKTNEDLSGQAILGTIQGMCDDWGGYVECIEDWGTGAGPECYTLNC